jgi:hypothetical protein
MAQETSTPGARKAFCIHIATKRYFLSDEPPATYLADETATTGYWCTKTMGAIGPDDDHVRPGKCASGRSCFVSNMARPV